MSITSKVFCRIILQHITTAVDKLLRQEQAGFRKGKSFIGDIFVLCQILEQSHEWNSSLYVVDFKKVFHSLHRPSQWKILQHHGIPQKLVNIIQALYKNFECRVIRNKRLTEPFRVDTGVKQGCIQSLVLFSMAMDWLMQTVTQGRCLSIQWTIMTDPEYLDYADKIGLLSSKHQDTQQKAERLSKTVSTIGLKVSTKKTQIRMKNTRVNDPVMIDGKHLEDGEEFTYLGTSDCNQEINTRISKAKQAFAMLRPVRRATNLSDHTNIKIFGSIVLSILLYGGECRETTVTIQQKLEVFQTKCLRRIVKIYWLNTISNEELRNRRGMDTLEEIIQTRLWRWLGHALALGTCPPTPSPEQPSDGHLRARERGDDQKRHDDEPCR